MTLYCNPELWQALPTKKQYELENTSEFTAIEEEIKALAPMVKTDSTIKDTGNPGISSPTSRVYHPYSLPAVVKEQSLSLIHNWSKPTFSVQ